MKKIKARAGGQRPSSRSVFGLRAKVLAAPVVILVIFAVVGVAAFLGFQDVRSRMNVVAGELAPDTALASDILTTLYRQRLRLDAFVISRDPALAGEFEDFGASLSKALKGANEGAAEPDRRKTLSHLASLAERYNAAFNDKVRPAASAIDGLTGSMASAGGAAADALDRLATRGTDSNDYLLAFQAQRASGSVNALRAAAQRYVGSHDPGQLDSARKQVKSLKADLDELNGYVLGEQQEGLLAAARKGVAEYTTTLDTLAGKLTALEDARNKTMGPIGREMASVARDLQDNAFGALDTVAQAANARTSSAMSLTVGLMAAAIVGGLVLALLITRTVMRP
ncbi:MAG: methyl-accepting chemotaxis protein, partial [Ectothiorhodospiraceae bacterium]